MKRTKLLQEVRKMRFKEAYGGWRRGAITQEEAAGVLGVCERTFRRYLVRYEEEGMEGLIDRRLGQISHRDVHRWMRLWHWQTYIAVSMRGIQQSTSTVGTAGHTRGGEAIPG